MSKNTRFKIIEYESRMMYVTNSTNIVSLSSEWVIIIPRQVKDLRKFDSFDKETKRRNHNRKAMNELFSSTTIKTTSTVIVAHEYW